ncbi:MAG: hypothetical protein C0617_16350 [Desulfuromonas sp.]|nr:MAG: hypothetical protein C0617_16350 [Desulfuromonas sp.]
MSVAFLGACASGSSSGPGTGGEGAYCPAPAGQAVMDYITKENPYQNWDLWPGKGKLYKGQHPHGSYLTTYVSPLAHGAIEDKAGEIPDTAFIVKENYTSRKVLAAVTVMYKKTGYNAAAGDWFWLKYTPDGKIEAEGKVAGCIGCHIAVKSNDWLFTGPTK